MIWWLVQTTLVALVLAALVALLCRLGRFRPAIRHALWVVVLLRLLAPPFVDWPWALPRLPDAWQLAWGATQSGLARQGPADAAASGFPSLAHLTDGNSEAVSLETLGWHAEAETSGASVPAAPAPEWVLSWIGKGLLYTWGMGMAVMALLQAVRIGRFSWRLRRAGPAPRWLLDEIGTLARALGVRPPKARVFTGVRSPCLWCLGRPQLLWPAALTDRLSAESRRGAVAHELAHLRRYDHWTGWLLLVGECVWWWDPVFWYVRKQLRFEAELACDSWVVWLFPEQRRAYAEALIEVTQLVSEQALPLPAMGMGSGARVEFERRLTMIMRDRAPCNVPLIGLCAAGLLCLLALPGWSQVKPQADDMPAAPQSESGEAQAEFLTVNVVEDAAVAALQTAIEQTYTVHLLESGDETEKPRTSERDQRLKEVEAKIHELAEEIRALRREAGLSPKQPLKIVARVQPGEKVDQRKVIRLEEVKPGDKTGKTADKAGESHERQIIILLDGDGKLIAKKLTAEGALIMAKPDKLQAGNVHVIQKDDNVGKLIEEKTRDGNVFQYRVIESGDKRTIITKPEKPEAGNVQYHVIRKGDNVGKVIEADGNVLEIQIGSDAKGTFIAKPEKPQAGKLQLHVTRKGDEVGKVIEGKTSEGNVLEYRLSTPGEVRAIIAKPETPQAGKGTRYEYRLITPGEKGAIIATPNATPEVRRYEYHLLRNGDKADKVIGEKVLEQPKTVTVFTDVIKQQPGSEKARTGRILINRLDATGGKSEGKTTLAPAVEGTLRLEFADSDKARVLNLRKSAVEDKPKEEHRVRVTTTTFVQATYHLTHAQAATLAEFLEKNVKAKFMEIKVEGDVLTITTTPEAQKEIGKLIGLVQGHKTAALKRADPVTVDPSVVKPLTLHLNVGK